MALHWNLEKCADTEALFQTYEQDGETIRRVSGMTEALIFASMVTGLGKDWSLTEEFAPEFYARIKLLEKLNGPMAFRPDGKGGHEDWFCTFEDVKRHIGMTVNVSPVSRTAFLKNAVAVNLDADARKYKRATEAVEA